MPPSRTANPSTEVLHSLTRALSAVSSQLHPDDLAEAIVDAFADTLQLCSASILVARPPRLLLLGKHGLPEEEVQDFTVVSIDSDYPSARGYREADVLIEPFEFVVTHYPEISGPNHAYGRMVARLGVGTTVSVGLSCVGVPVGSLVLHSQGERQWTSVDAAAVGALASALGVWLTHPDSGAPPEQDDALGELTSRQEQILRLMAAGKSNAAIGHRLAFSSSTIKQEVGRILDLFDASTRMEAVERARLAGLLDEAPS